jgi:hypothetical protein
LNGPALYSRSTPMRRPSTHSKGCSSQSTAMPALRKAPKRRTRLEPNPGASSTCCRNCTGVRPAARLKRSVLETWGHSRSGGDSSSQSQA